MCLSYYFSADWQNDKKADKHRQYVWLSVSVLLGLCIKTNNFSLFRTNNLVCMNYNYVIVSIRKYHSSNTRRSKEANELPISKSSYLCTPSILVFNLFLQMHSLYFLCKCLLFYKLMDVWTVLITSLKN